MSTKSFFTSLLLVTLTTSCILGAIHLCFTLFSAYTSLSIGSVLLFVTTSIILFFLGKSSTKSKNKHLFNGIISSSVLFKMILSLAFLLIYKNIAAPKDGYFTILFLIAYVVYTAYEVWFMLRLAKNSNA